MTIESSVTRHTYRPGAAMAQEALTDIIWLNATDLIVTRSLPDGSSNLLALDEDYQVGGDGANMAGWIKALNAELDTTVYRIQRQTDLNQSRKFPKFQPVDAPEMENGLDKNMMIAQELRNDQGNLSDRTLKVPDGSAAPPVNLMDLLDGDILQYRNGQLSRMPRQDFSGMFYAGDATGRMVPASGTGADAALRTDLASQVGGSLVAYNNLFNYSNGTVGYALRYRVQPETLATNLVGFPGQKGTKWQSQYHANWNVIQSEVPWNPTEWQIYTNAASGIAQVVNGTNQVVRVSGAAFDPAWVGTRYFYWEGSGFKVTSVTDGDHMTVANTDGSPLTWGATLTGTYYYCVTTVEAVVNTQGTLVTRVSGQPFVPTPTDKLTINGVDYTIASFNSVNSLTLTTSAGVQNGVALKQYSVIANELANIRLQGLAGSSEENWAVTITPQGTFIQNVYAGQGKYRPMFIGTGENPEGSFNPQIAMYQGTNKGDPGTVFLGGSQTTAPLVVSQDSTSRNYFHIFGAAPGGTPTFQSRGADNDVGMSFDTQGGGIVAFTAANYAHTQFRIFANAGVANLYIGPGAVTGSGAAYLGAEGPGPDADIRLVPKGAGAVLLGAYTAGAPAATGYLTVKDSNGTARRLLCA